VRLTLLGTGTPAPSLRRRGSSYLIEVAGDVLLFDHGPGSHDRLLESGRRAVDVTRVLFSHLHYDHCVDYARLVLQRWDQGGGRVSELSVHGPPPIARMTELLFGAEGVYGPDIAARLGHESSLDVFRSRGGDLPRRPPAPRVTEVHAGSVIEGDGWRITVGHAAHVQPFLECIAFRLDSEEGSICYAGDGSPCAALVELARDCDVLIQMNHYISGTEPSAAFREACGHHLGNARLAREAGVKTLILTHVPPDLDTADIRDRVLAEAREIFEGRVFWGEDLMELTVDG
jgi:ribonuclease BN (tRNA processing enzyme)